MTGRREVTQVGASEARAGFVGTGSWPQPARRARLSRLLAARKIDARAAVAELRAIREAEKVSGAEELRRELDQLRARRSSSATLRVEMAARATNPKVEEARQRAAEPFVRKQVWARVYRADRGGWGWERVTVKVPRAKPRWTGLKL